MDPKAKTLLMLSFLASLTSYGWSADEPQQPQLPATVVRALDTYDADVQKAQADYRKEVDRAKAKATKAIEREQERATKAGDLELALAIKAKADAVDKHTAGGLAELDILGNKLKEEKAAAQLREVRKSLIEESWTYNWVGKVRKMEFRKDGSIGVGSHTNENKWTLDPTHMTLSINRADDTVFATLKYNPEKKEWRGLTITKVTVFVAIEEKTE